MLCPIFAALSAFCLGASIVLLIQTKRLARQARALIADHVRANYQGTAERWQALAQEIVDTAKGVTNDHDA